MGKNIRVTDISELEETYDNLNYEESLEFKKNARMAKTKREILSKERTTKSNKPVKINEK